MEMKLLSELRKEFEVMARSKYFYLDRNNIGEYSNINTFLLWGGYWECAIANNLLLENQRDPLDMNKK